MAHLLVFELPGGNDADVLQAALDRGDRFTFLSAQIGHYRAQAEVWALVSQASHWLDVPGLRYPQLEQQVLALHASDPFDAVLCLIDIRLVDAAHLAKALGLRFLNVRCATLLRDKFKVRSLLQSCGIAQPAFALAQSNEELQNAVAQLGLPVLIKPVDGFGSQNIVLIEHPEDLDPLLTPLGDMLPSGVDYGLGVKANDRLLVERYMTGTVVGCDTLSRNGVHQLLGVNEKVFYAQPSFAIRGGTFTPMAPEFSDLESYVFSLLDAVGFDWGAAHIELMLTRDGPQLIEINARLVGAKIARLMGLALGTSMHQQLIALHLGEAGANCLATGSVATTRWIVADQAGVLASITLPAQPDPAIGCVEILKHPGDRVQPAMDNADRIGYVMVCASTRQAAEDAAQAYVDQCVCHYQT
ncbi:MAG: ATP-grasp domain-containing protein [Betaproteobacteria bacterium]